MNARTTSFLVILGTLLVGIMIGALATGAIVNQRVEALQALRMEGGFMKMLERQIEPVDDKQKGEIRAVLKEAARRQTELRRDMISEHRALFNDLRSELDEILTPEQRERLRSLAERERQRDPGWRRPPEFMRPPRTERFNRVPSDSLHRRRLPFRQRATERTLPDDTLSTEKN